MKIGVLVELVLRDERLHGRDERDRHENGGERDHQREAEQEASDESQSEGRRSDRAP